jgi:hypothetical protein
VVSFKPLPLYPRGKSTGYPLDRRLGGTLGRYGRYGEVKKLDLTGTKDVEYVLKTHKTYKANVQYYATIKEPLNYVPSPLVSLVKEPPSRGSRTVFSAGPLKSVQTMPSRLPSSTSAPKLTLRMPTAQSLTSLLYMSVHCQEQLYIFFLS